MFRLNTDTNENTLEGNLRALMLYYLIADASRTRLGNKIYSLKKTIANNPIDDIPQIVEDELIEYLQDHFDTLEVSANDVRYSDSVEKPVDPPLYRLGVDIKVGKYFNGELKTTELKTVLSEDEMESVFDYLRHK